MFKKMMIMLIFILIIPTVVATQNTIVYDNFNDGVINSTLWQTSQIDQQLAGYADNVNTHTSVEITEHSGKMDLSSFIGPIDCAGASGQCGQRNWNTLISVQNLTFNFTNVSKKIRINWSMNIFSAINTGGGCLSESGKSPLDNGVFVALVDRGNHSNQVIIYETNNTGSNTNQTVNFQLNWSSVTPTAISVNVTNLTHNGGPSNYVNYTDVTKLNTSGEWELKFETRGWVSRNDAASTCRNYHQLLISDIEYLINTAPTITNLQISPVGPQSANTLNCTHTFNDADGDPVNRTYYSWHKDGVKQVHNSSTQTLNSANTTTGDLWSCSVIFFDGFDNSTEDYSPNVTIDDNINPILRNLAPQVSSAYVNSDTVNVTANCSDVSSSINSVLYTITKPSGTVNESMLLLKENTYQDLLDVTATGTYNISAFHCQDSSGNWNTTLFATGFTVTAPDSGAPGGGGGGGGGVTETEVEELILGLTCGNNVCDKNENVVTCANDCKFNFDTVLCFNTEDPNCLVSQFLFTNLLLYGLGILFIIFVFRTQTGGKKK